MPTIYRNHLSGLTSDNPLTNVATTVTSTAFVNLPVVSAPDTMWVVLDPTGVSGAPEIVRVTTHTASATTVTVDRAQQGTAARQHPSGTLWEVPVTRSDLDELPFRVMTSTGDMLYASGANTAARLPVGGAGVPLVVDAGVPSWQQVGTAGIADGAITTAKVADGTIALGDLAAAVQELLVPAGALLHYIGTTAPAGWLLHNQTVANAQSLYPALWSAAPAAWKSGSSLVIPDLTDVVLAQTGGSAALLGATGGSMSTTITSADLPVHTHAAGTLAVSAHIIGDPQHGHFVHDPGHAHSPGGGYSNFVVQNLSGSNALDTLAGTGATIDNRTATASSTTGVSVSTSFTGITIDNHTVSGSTGNGGFANSAMTTRPKHLGTNVILKAH